MGRAVSADQAPPFSAADQPAQARPGEGAQLHGAEREAAWQSMTKRAPGFLAYQEKTDRELPIIRLTPRAA